MVLSRNPSVGKEVLIIPCFGMFASCAALLSLRIAPGFMLNRRSVELAAGGRCQMVTGLFFKKNR